MIHRSGYIGPYTGLWDRGGECSRRGVAYLRNIPPLLSLIDRLHRGDAVSIVMWGKYVKAIFLFTLLHQALPLYRGSVF